MKTVIIIPARYKSSRLPGKPLKKILNKELVIWVAQTCEKVLSKKKIFIASDDNRIISKVKKYGYNAIKTSKSCYTGTDRVAEAAKKINSNIFINVQGDEPLLNPKDIKKIIKEKIKYPKNVICGYTQIQKNENPSNPNLPKVVMNENKELLYMSRSVVPSTKKTKRFNNIFFKQVCIYAFSKNELKMYYKFKKRSYLEKVEDIEILRFFELNKKIRMVKTSSGSIAVDVKNDIKKVERILKRNEKKIF